MNKNKEIEFDFWKKEKSSLIEKSSVIKEDKELRNEYKGINYFLNRYGKLIVKTNVFLIIAIYAINFNACYKSDYLAMLIAFLGLSLLLFIDFHTSMNRKYKKRESEIETYILERKIANHALTKDLREMKLFNGRWWISDRPVTVRDNEFAPFFKTQKPKWKLLKDDSLANKETL